MTNQDSAFYTDHNTPQMVWRDEANPRFYVVRNGEMRINAIDDKGTRHIIRYTDQLMDFGIKTDEELQTWSDKGNTYDGIFEWINNSWFEVWDSTDDENGDEISNVYDTLDDAISIAVDFQNIYGNDGKVE
jgi:hypothetical protein